MKNRHLKYLSLLIVVFIISSCSTLKIHSANKSLVIPGISKAKKFMLYKVEFNSNQNFSIDKIVLGNKPINTFSIYNADTKLYENVDKNSFKKGTFLLSFKLLNSNTENNTVTLYVKQGKRTKTISTELKTTNTIYRR
jgi:hypothetical protein